ncbi:FliH/SctL family protein [Pseudoduganella violaceinigra]|uniref:FliH/SctL family protein n=1 Tax=Pseudoduganella violaceinigra TaxID=246602 RepID=UPI0003F7FF12|nr:HrpE/YscL family type III secretion apparatus protein [Pseudoduganella violaceinigra]
MNGFCAGRVSVDPDLLSQHGVLHAAAMKRTADAHVLAERIVEQGREDAERLLTEARSAAQQAVFDAESRVLEQGMLLQQGMDAAMAGLLEQAQDIVAGLAGTLYDRLLLQTTDGEKIAAACRHLLREAPPKLVNALLRLHPADMPPPDGLPWPCEADPALEPGSCKLEAGSGEWRVDLSAAASALRQALAALPARHEAQADS